MAGFTPWLLAGPRGLLKSGTRDADGTNSRRGRLDRPGLLADLHGVGAAASRPEPWMTEVATDDKQPMMASTPGPRPSSAHSRNAARRVDRSDHGGGHVRHHVPVRPAMAGGPS